MMAFPRVAWRAASLGLLVLAVALAWLAFTRFDATPSAAGSPEEQRDLERGQVDDAQLSIALGIAAAFALLGTLACWQRGDRAPQDESGESRGPPQP